MTQRQAIKAAKKRGLVTEEQVRAIALPRHLRHCPADGKTFLPVSAGHKGFCCACCAYDWGEQRERGLLDRRIAKGVEVVFYDDGKVGVVESVSSTEQAIVLAEDGRRLTVAPKDVERIQYMQTAHRKDCQRNASRAWVQRLSKKSDQERGEPGNGEDK